MKAENASLRESHALSKAVTALFTSKADARYNAVTSVLAHHRLIEGLLLQLCFLSHHLQGRVHDSDPMGGHDWTAIRPEVL